jgi:hypothetical protein
MSAKGGRQWGAKGRRAKGRGRRKKGMLVEQNKRGNMLGMEGKERSVLGVKQI